MKDSIDGRRTLVIYHYFEANPLYAYNLDTFLRLGINENTHYLFVLASDCTIEIPAKAQIRTVSTENTGSDFNGFSEALSTLDRSDYDAFIFINCTVCGPFLPLCERREWQDRIVDMLRGDVKLVGSTINVLPPHSGFAEICGTFFGKAPPFPHVQSMFFAMDRECLDHLIEEGFFTVRLQRRHDLIARSEIGMSHHVLARGWNIACLIPEMQGLDFRTIEGDVNPTSTEGDPWFAGGCWGRTLHPLETMFFKANRGLMTQVELESLVGAQLAQRRTNPQRP